MRESQFTKQYPDKDDFNDPSVVENLLAKEILAMDLKERNEIQEAVHGVVAPAVETPEKIAKALADLQQEIDRMPASGKQAYIRSQEMPASHIQTKSFRLRMLRAHDFQIVRTAEKIVIFCDVLVDLFGEYALQRPIRLSDFSKKELQLMRMGRVQFLPFGDRTGRRILTWFQDEVWETFPPQAKAKISLYMSWVAGNDLMTQRKGIVAVVWYDKEFKITSSRPVNKKYNDHWLHTTRATAIHLCSPDTPFFRFRTAVATMKLSRARRYLRTHFGDSMENRYSLQSFGIACDQIPVSYTGKIKLGYIRQWIGVRTMIESAMESNDCMPPPEVIIEYPLPVDVVFRQGSSCASHPANLSFRNLIISKVQEQELSKDGGGIKIRRKKMVMDVIHDVRIQNGGRFLIWNDKGGWNELFDDELIVSKIEYLIKEFRKTVRIKTSVRPQTILSSDTSMFRSDYSNTTKGSVGPFDLHHDIDEKGLMEAACCVANCFDLNMPKTV